MELIGHFHPSIRHLFVSENKTGADAAAVQAVSGIGVFRIYGTDWSS
jgi:hypothetical protein